MLRSQALLQIFHLLHIFAMLEILKFDESDSISSGVEDMVEFSPHQHLLLKIKNVIVLIEEAYVVPKMDMG